ncbi:MAG: type II secretion system protein [Planctomycetota bacterium]|jgi:prepilin-type N-terminal cleavage/methylation domain-containing protein
MQRSTSRFTLTELLVVIAIIAILAGLILPTLVGAQDETRKVACMNNLKQVVTGMELYKNDYGNNWPLFLTQLQVTKTIEDGEVFVCPQDSSSGAQGARPDHYSDQYPNADKDGASYNLGAWSGGSILDSSDADDIPSSYLFEFNYYDCDWATGDTDSWLVKKNRELSGQDSVWKNNNDHSQGTIKVTWIPVIRCYWHLKSAHEGTQIGADELPVVDMTNFLNIRPSDYAYWPLGYD